MINKTPTIDLLTNILFESYNDKRISEGEVKQCGDFLLLLKDNGVMNSSDLKDLIFGGKLSIIVKKGQEKE